MDDAAPDAAAAAPRVRPRPSAPRAPPVPTPDATPGRDAPPGPAAPPDVVGWREWVALPDLGVGRIKAKVDTGARSSALHAWNLEEFQRDGVRYVRFVVHPWQHDVAKSIVCECEWIGERAVRSSHGHSETRPVVRTTLEVGGRRWPIELTLTNRDTMGFRMLVGRLAVRGRFVVDPGRSFVQPRPRRRRKRPHPAPERSPA